MIYLIVIKDYSATLLQMLRERRACVLMIFASKSVSMVVKSPNEGSRRWTLSMEWKIKKDEDEIVYSTGR